jgi:DNA helicase II / ATP-dependent DNA helicase PcrA
MPEILQTPAQAAAQRAWDRLQTCMLNRKSFRLEAGAGAGKTYSLIEALKYLIHNRGKEFLRQHQRIACITYTNVATSEIQSRTDRHPVISSSTIHAFCWSSIKSFQPLLRRGVASLPNWRDRLTQVPLGDNHVVEYNLGYPKIDERTVLLGHDDVLALFAQLLANSKFRQLLAARYPIIFVDEYQDTSKAIVDALEEHVLGAGSPVIGFFGDHWQKIYRDGCGSIEHPALEVIGKEANFRSSEAIVTCLNRIRPELPQHVHDTTVVGSVSVYHTNNWIGERRPAGRGGHWRDDLPAEPAHFYLQALRERLANEGWDLAPSATKVLMLTHNVLATEQGYEQLTEVFEGRTDALIKHEDAHISFFVNTLEPICEAYVHKLFGEMFDLLGLHAPPIVSSIDKSSWASMMDSLVRLRETATIGEVLDFVRSSERIPVPEAIQQKEDELSRRTTPAPEPDPIERIRNLRRVHYKQVIALERFIQEKTPFATKHGVKGAEFENVLVVFGRGWNLYDFNQFLEWRHEAPPDKTESYERNRNLFYVVCSRPKKRLALLFTQKLSSQALATLTEWFGNNVTALPAR